jgi:hypothetical protein
MQEIQLPDVRCPPGFRGLAMMNFHLELSKTESVDIQAAQVFKSCVLGSFDVDFEHIDPIVPERLQSKRPLRKLKPQA